MRDRLISFRKSLGLTIDEMSKKIGVSNSFYEKIEYGDRNPSFNFISSFKTAFPDTNADDIFFDNTLHDRCR